MSSGSILILSSSATLSTSSFISSLRAKTCGSTAKGHRVHHVTSLSTNRSTAARAGLGRYSGAIHGNSKKKSRIRRPPAEVDQLQECDQHEDSTSTSENLSNAEGRRDGKAGDAAAAEGLREEFIADRPSDGSLESSYNRYLMELGVSPQSHQDSKSEMESRDFLRNLDAANGENSSHNGSQLSAQGDLREIGITSSQVHFEGRRRDIDIKPTEDVNVEQATDAERDRGKLAKENDIILDNEGKLEMEKPVHETDQVAAREFQAADLVPGTSSSSEDAGQHTDRISNTKFFGEPDSVSDGTSKKKRRKKPKTRAVASSSLKSQRADKENVRVSTGEAERPAISNGAENLVAMNGSARAFHEAKNFDSKEDYGTNDSAKTASPLKSGSDYFPVDELADKDGRSSIELDTSVDSESAHRDGEVPTAIDSVVTPISTSHVNSKDESPESNPQDTAVSVLGKAGTTTESEFHVQANEPEELMLSRISSLNGAHPTRVGNQVETVLEQAVQTAVKVVPVEIVEQAAQVASKVVELPVAVVEHASQIGAQVADVLPDVVTEQVSQVAEVVTEQVSQVAEVVTEQVSQVTDVVTEQVSQVAEVVTEQVEQVAENVSSTASQVAESLSQGVDNVTSTASQVVDQVADFFTSDEEDDSDSDDEFEAYITSDLPEFRGKEGLNNFIVRQENEGVLFMIYDFYTYMLKQSFPKFAAAMFAAPVIVSGIFTLLYLPEFEGLAFDETARDFFAAAGGDSLKLHISWKTVFQVFMFSLSLSTGLQPELAPLSPYTLIVANLNALVAQLVFVFLSGAVFARLSQPSQPLRCSTVALVSTSPAQRRKENGIKVFVARYVLAGPQPCELVDVKVDLTYKYNTHTRTGSYFRATQTLKLAIQPLTLVRSEIALLTHLLLVKHVIDETSPLYQKTPEMLNKEDAVFCLTLLGLEKSSMCPVSHVQHYCVVNNHVIWDAEFEDLVLINKKNQRILDHSRLSMWKPLVN